MSQANVEIAKRAHDAFNRRDFDCYEEFATFDCEWFPAMPGAIEGGNYRGRDGIESYLREIGELWESFRAIYDEWHDLGDRVLALGRYEARGRGSGVPVEAQLGGIWDVRDRKISRVRNYLDHGEALRAVGISE